MSAGSRTAKTHHGAEAREEQNLVKLAAKFHARRAGENLVTRHLAVRIDGDVNQQAVRQRKFTVLLLRRPGFRVVRERNQFGGAHQIESDVVLHGAHGRTGQNHLKHEHEDENGGKKAARSRQRERAENVVQQDFGAILDAANAARPIARMLRLSSSDLNADGEIGRRNVRGHTRKHDGQLAEAFQLFAANVATFEVLANPDALGDARSASDGIIEITSQFRTYCIALHGSPSPGELALGDFISDCEAVNPSKENVNRRAAENASPKGDGRASETLPCEDVCAWLA